MLHRPPSGRTRSLLTLCAVLGAVALEVAGASQAAASPARAATATAPAPAARVSVIPHPRLRPRPRLHPHPHPHPLLRSRLLWATLDICNAPDQPDTIGVRGSMPGDGRSGEQMYMRFRVQYHDAATNRWRFVATDGDSGLLAVGSAREAAREDGRSFQFTPGAGHAPYRLRGLVSFEWKRAGHVVRDITLATTAGHLSGASADPPGFSASSCVIA